MKVKEVLLEQLSTPEKYKEKANEYWHAAQEASKNGDGHTAERLFDLGALFP